MEETNNSALKTVILLIISNIFMTIAWYGHLKYRYQPLLPVIAVSWGIAFFEYIFQVPANRIGAERFTVTQLKIMQECITLTVFTVFALLVFHEPLKWNNLISYGMIVGAVYFAFHGEHVEEAPMAVAEERAAGQ
jgi:uncharacterized protein